MSKDRIDEINDKLKEIRRFVAELTKFKGIKGQELEVDELKKRFVEREFQLAAELVLDVCGLVIAEYGYRTPEDYKDKIVILGENGVLTREFADKFKSVAGLRNILVHDYVQINYNELARFLDESLGDFEEFIRMVAKSLK